MFCPHCQDDACAGQVSDSHNVPGAIARPVSFLMAVGFQPSVEEVLS